MVGGTAGGADSSTVHKSYSHLSLWGMRVNASEICLDEEELPYGEALNSSFNRAPLNLEVAAALTRA